MAEGMPSRQVHPYDQPEAPGVWGDSPEEVGQKAMLGSATKADAQVCPPLPHNYEGNVKLPWREAGKPTGVTRNEGHTPPLGPTVGLVPGA